MVRWGIFNASVRPELSVIDMLQVSYNDEVQSKGAPQEMMQTHMVFRESIESSGVNPTNSDKWSASYNTTFLNVPP